MLINDTYKVWNVLFLEEMNRTAAKITLKKTNAIVVKIIFFK